LPGVTEALGLLGFGFGARQRREEEPSKDGDDRDDHQ